MKSLFTFFYLLSHIYSYAQNIKSIDSNHIVKNIFYEITGSYESKYVSVEDIYKIENRNIKISIDTLCINNSCYYITSPVYYSGVQIEEYKFIYFFFRLKGGVICILYIKENELLTIETCNPKNKEFIQYAHIKPEK